MNSLPNN